MNLLRSPPNNCMASPADPGNHPNIAWLSTDTTKYIFAATTQYACTPCTSMSTILNVHHCDEAVAPDTVHSSTPDVDSRVNVTHFFDGCDSLVCSIYGISGQHLVNNLEDDIHVQGAPTKSDSDCTLVEISEKLQDITVIYAMNDLVPYLGLLYMVVGSLLQGMDCFQFISSPKLAILFSVYGEKVTASMPRGFAITLTNPNTGAFTYTGDAFVQCWESTPLENVTWFPPDQNLPPSQPSLHLLYKLHAQDSLEAMSIKDVECLEERVILSLESNGQFEFEDSFLAMKICYPLGTLLFACQIDGCSPEVCSHILSVSPSFAPSLPNDFLYNTEMGYLMGDSTKHLKSLTKDNFQLVLVKTGGTQFANIKSKVLSICLPRISCIRVWLVLETGSTQLANVESKISSIHRPRIFCITQFLNLLNSSSEDASPFPYDRGKMVP